MKRFSSGNRVFLRPALVGSEKQGTIESDDGGARVFVLVDGSKKPKPFKRARVRLQPDVRTTLDGPFRSRPAIPPPPPNPIVDDEPRIPGPSSDDASPPRKSSSVSGSAAFVAGAVATGARAPLPIPQPKPGTVVSRVERDRDANVAQLRPVPKSAAPARDPRYLAFVRTFACISCGATESVEAHHWARRGMKGLASKPSDYNTVPLCQRCHDHFHNTGELPRMNAATSRVWFLTKQFELAVAWIGEIAAPRRSRRARS